MVVGGWNPLTPLAKGTNPALHLPHLPEGQVALPQFAGHATFWLHAGAGGFDDARPRAVPGEDVYGWRYLENRHTHAGERASAASASSAARSAARSTERRAMAIELFPFKGHS